MITEKLSKLIKHKKILLYLYMAVLTVIICYFASKIYKTDNLIWPRERYIIVVTMIISFYMVLFKLFFDNKMDLMKGVYLYHFVLFAPIFLMAFPIDCYELRPLYLVPMVVVVVSDLALGLISGVAVIVATYVMIFTNLAEFMYISLIMMIFACIAAAQITNQKKYIGFSILFASVSFYLCGLYRYFALDSNYQGFQEQIACLGALMSIACCLILFVIKYWIFFLRIQMFVGENSIPLKDMKEASISLYYHSVEVGELSKLAAAEIGADKKLANAGGLLHDIGRMKANGGLKEGLQLANEYGIPQNIKSILVECSGKYRKPTTKEAAIVMLAESVVTTIEYLRNENLKNEKKQIEEKKVIESVIATRCNNGSLKNSGLNLEELYRIKRVFEKKYGG